MSEQVVGALRAHLPRDRYDDDGTSVGTCCTCGGWEGDYFADGEAGPFDAHLAETLEPLIAERERAAVERAWGEAAELADTVIVSWQGVAGLHPTQPEPHPAAIAAAGARRTLVVLRSRMADALSAARDYENEETR